MEQKFMLVEEYSYWKRITKYDPCSRNEHGAYIHPEWTAVSDIGKVFGDELFTWEEYLRVESNYVQAACLLFAEATQITLVGLESWGRSPDQ